MSDATDGHHSSVKHKILGVIQIKRLMPPGDCVSLSRVETGSRDTVRFAGKFCHSRPKGPLVCEAGNGVIGPDPDGGTVTLKATKALAT